MDESKHTDDLVESMVSELYLKASGETIDRMREHITRMFQTKPRDGIVVITMSSENYVLQLGADVRDLEEISQNSEFKNFVDKEIMCDSRCNIATILHKAAEEFARMNSKDPGKFVKSEHEQGAAFIFYCMGSLFMESKKTKNEEPSFRREGYGLYISSLVFSLINGDKQTMFSAVWRRL